MMEKTLLLIDDSKELEASLDTLKAHMKSSESIILHPYYINPNDREFWNNEDDRVPNLNKLIQGINSTRHSMKPDLILVDHFYGADVKFNGFDVIKKLREIPKFKKCSIFIISGKREQIVRDLVMDEAEMVKSLSNIISLQIDGFFDKDFRAEAIRLLKQSKLENILPTKLRDYDGDNAVVNCFTPKYKTLTFSELADKIEGDAPEAKEILDEMFGITLSHYANINEKL